MAVAGATTVYVRAIVSAVDSALAQAQVGVLPVDYTAGLYEPVTLQRGDTVELSGVEIFGKLFASQIRVLGSGGGQVSVAGVGGTGVRLNGIGGSDRSRLSFFDTGIHSASVGNSAQRDGIVGSGVKLNDIVIGGVTEGAVTRGVSSLGRSGIGARFPDARLNGISGSGVRLSGLVSHPGQTVILSVDEDRPLSVSHGSSKGMWR